MKFSIEYTGKTEQRLLTYNLAEFSFDIEPAVQFIDFDIVVNKLNLTVVDYHKVIQVWGYCGLSHSIKSNYEAPKYEKGLLKIIDDFKPGFSYRLTNEELPIYVNSKTGWICIGDPLKIGNAVEFINNCIAVIDDNKEFVSLWLKPYILPTSKTLEDF